MALLLLEVSDAGSALDLIGPRRTASVVQWQHSQGLITNAKYEVRPKLREKTLEELGSLLRSGGWVLNAQTAITPRYLIFPSSNFLNACSTPWTFIGNLSMMGWIWCTAANSSISRWICLAATTLPCILRPASRTGI